ncbi:hypothetical protein DY000_02013963 [Brassica cretica]|uniref:Uncharacterized protein n=1 Tax=Brassica cretica TaxID=69181 RepID=A0ABQ7DB01_BRACR|nr:hypothetical protein DY000_02013963 [Brassica cretica]
MEERSILMDASNREWRGFRRAGVLKAVQQRILSHLGLSFLWYNFGDSKFLCSSIHSLSGRSLVSELLQQRDRRHWEGWTVERFYGAAENAV